MYYICKFSGSWSLYDAEKQNSRPLVEAEIASIKALFPTLLGDNRILVALQISAINPSKLTQITVSESTTAPQGKTIPSSKPKEDDK